MIVVVLFPFSLPPCLKYFSLFFLGLSLTDVFSQPRQQKKECFPDKETVKGCFLQQNLPTDRPDWLPNKTRDSIVLENLETFDATEYATEKLTVDHSTFCQ